MNLIERLRRHALPDPHDEREVLHAPLLKEAADLIESLQARVKKLEAKCDRFENLYLQYDELAHQKGHELAALRQKIEDAPSVAYERKVHGGFAVTYIPSGAGEHEELIRRKDLK